MSLLYCPECNHEVSTGADACPNCGLRMRPPAVEKRVLITKAESENSFPPWAIAAVVFTGIAVLILGFLLFRSTNDQGNTNVNVNLAGRRNSTNEPLRDTKTTTVPSTSTDVPVTSSAPTQTTTVQSTETSVPNAPPPDKGVVKINARIAPRQGDPRAASGTKFYLLDKDVEQILSEARVEPIEGNTLAASLGLAAVFPDRYGEFQRAAMRAIGSHVKYSGTTGGSGTTDLKGVSPSSYYLFAISRVGRGFALWNSPVSVIAGDNVMNLSPQSVTEIPDPNG
ncbi:MAG: zinc ribbon domain-containing protein [Pyrinomonadaceae bacterium]|nr:zinc ribbon domain-containing protein [Pyrinomonadaceae bacterium]